MGFRLYAVRIFVEDWEKALAFYKDSVGIPTSFEGPEMGWAELDTGAAKLAIERVDDDEGRALVGRYVGVSLQV